VPSAEIRASFLKYMVAYCRRAPEAQRLLTLLEPHRATIREAPLLGWLSAELLLQICDQVGQLLGRTSAPEFWREMMYDSTDRALPAPILRAAVHIYGRTLGAMSRSAPQVWALLTRGCGGPVPLLSDERLLLSYGGLPPAMCRSPAFAWFLVGACRANAMLLEVPANVTAEPCPGEIVIHVEKA
jgi:hypothetical protein